MKRKQKSVGLVAFSVFVALILVTGYMLNAAGYDNNPFDQIAFLSGSVGGGEGRSGRDFAGKSGNSDFALPASNPDNTGIDLTGVSTTNSQFQLPSVSELNSPATDNAVTDGTVTFDGLGRGDENSIAWSDLGDVLYNLWFICAITAVFIVVQKVFKFSLKQFKSRLPIIAATK